MEITSNSNIKILGGDYVFGDYQLDGVIQIVGKENIVIDGDSVTVHGGNYTGYMINIENSDNIIIKNFEQVNNYKYAVRCLNSHDIMIEGNNFSHNKKDTTGWIQIWTTYTAALGGGVLFYNSSRLDVHDNLMTQQNDGVAMYQCDSAVIYNNIMNWNCGFGVRMNFTDNCWIHHNDLSNVNRETDPSDCAAILLIVSNSNLVEYNDLTNSGDGVFLGQYEYSQIPNNNRFYYNDCSYSPHNAVEATFADGNIYKFNNCNYSQYGFWLGYSFNTIVDSNEVIGNQNTGIAIDRGFNNSFTGNQISENPVGLDVWEGSAISPYQDQFSHDYFLYNNLFEGNFRAVQAKKTEHLIAKNNHFLNNRSDFYFEGDSFNDTISNNIFEGTTTYYFENKSPDNIYATDNQFIWMDDELTACKIYDKNDNAVYGDVIWQPFQPGQAPVYQTIPEADMAEPPAVWYAYPEACLGYGLHQPTTVDWDYNLKMVGEASIHLNTANGWDLGMMYRPGNNELASWNLTEQDSLVIWLKSVNNTGYGFQFCHIKLGNNCGGYYKYTASAATILNPTMTQWKRYKVPLAGGSPWSRSIVGDVSLSDISYVEFHADTWDMGFELWIDGMTFAPFVTSVDEQQNNTTNTLVISPNPVSGVSKISFDISKSGNVNLSLYNCNGVLVRPIANEFISKGPHEMALDNSSLKSGIYYLTLKTGQVVESRKVVVIR
jgi:parallel beta-helix repeat protein